MIRSSQRFISRALARLNIGKAGVTALVAVAVVVNTCAARGAAYSASYVLETGFEANDNVRLVASDETDLQGFYISPTVTFAVDTPTLSAALDTRLDFSRFNEEAYDSEDQALKGKGRYLFERGQFDVDAAFVRDSTRTSELLDTGRIGLEAVRKENFAAGGGFLYQLDERNALQLAGNYSEVSYQSADFQDYQVTGGSLAWVHAYSERMQVQTVLYGSHYETDEAIPVEYDTYGARLGLDAEISEKLTLSVSGGSAHVDTDQGGGDSNSFIVDASLKYVAPRYQLGLKLARANDPSGDGTLKETDRLVADYLYRLDERSQISSAATLLQSGSVDQGVNDQRDYASLKVGYNYLLTEALTLIAEYSYQYQDRESDSASANANAIYVRLRYQPTAETWSR